MLEMPRLETARLLIRPFVKEDLHAAHRLFDIELNAEDMGAEKMTTLREREEWLRWVALNPRQLALLNQPPYGDRAIVLRSNGTLIGSCGYVPALNAFEQVPVFDDHDPSGRPGRYSPEFALFYAISPSYQRQGYACEAVQAMIDYAFDHLHVRRIIAETDFDNAGSIAVMRKLGMKIGKNPLAEPPWLQVVGVLENNR